jgi:hypothetical protein
VWISGTAMHRDKNMCVVWDSGSAKADGGVGVHVRPQNEHRNQCEGHCAYLGAWWDELVPFRLLTISFVCAGVAGGGMLLSDLINVPITPQRLPNNVLVLVLDLSKVCVCIDFSGIHAHTSFSPELAVILSLKAQLTPPYSGWRW